MNQIIHIEDGEAVAFGRGLTSPSAQAPAAGSHIIQFPFQSPVAATSMALEDASDPVEGFESIGSLAVRLVADWSLPRLLVLVQQTREG